VGIYHVLAGKGLVRHQDGTTEIEPGDAFIFAPGEPHQVTNNAGQDLVMLIVAAIRLVSPAITLIARNGSCNLPSPDWCAPIRSTIYDGEE
jgi:uncharacterized cupin superfamily protein